MIHNNEYKGFWFLPDKPKNKVAGILYFKANDSIKLELIGGFDSELSQIIKSKTIKIIYGFTSNAEKITLINCFSSFSLNFSSNHPLTKYSCQYLVVGKHLKSMEDEIFDRIRVDMSSLYNWIPAGIIKHSISYLDDDKIKANFSLSQNDNWEKRVENDELIISFLSSFQTKSRVDNEQTLIENTFLEISKKNMKSSFSELLNNIGIFKHFLSLASLSNTSYRSITLYDNDGFQQLKNEKKIFHSTYLFYIDRNNIYKISKNNSSHLFKYKDVEDQYPYIINKWFDFKNELAPIRNHLVKSIIRTGTFTSLDFLILVQALEGFHRRFINNKRTSLKSRITFLTLKFEDVIKVNLDKKDILSVVASRDYYSHFFEEKENVLDGLELYDLSEKLRILLICCLLNLIGFENEQINLLLNKNYGS